MCYVCWWNSLVLDCFRSSAAVKATSSSNQQQTAAIRKKKRKKYVLKNIRLHSNGLDREREREKRSENHHHIMDSNAKKAVRNIYIYFVIYKRWNVLPSQIGKCELRKRIYRIYRCCFFFTFFTFTENERWIFLFRIFLSVFSCSYLRRPPPLSSLCPNFTWHVFSRYMYMKIYFDALVTNSIHWHFECVRIDFNLLLNYFYWKSIDSVLTWLWCSWWFIRSECHVFCVYIAPKRKEQITVSVFCIQYPFITMEYSIFHFRCIIYRIVGGRILNIQTLSRMNWQTKWKRSAHIKRIGITHSKNYHTPVKPNPIRTNSMSVSVRVRECQQRTFSQVRPVQNSICIRSFLGVHAFLNHMNCEWMRKITLKFSHEHSKLRIHHRIPFGWLLAARLWASQPANRPTDRPTNHRPLYESIQQQCV